MLGWWGLGSLSYYQYFQPAENTKLQKEALPATVKRRKLAGLGHVTRHDSLSKAILSGHLGEWATQWSAEEMLNGQRQRVSIPVHARSGHKGDL